MKFFNFFYIFNILINNFFLAWSITSFNEFRVDYVYNNVIIESVYAKNLIFQTLLIALSSILPLFKFHVLHFFSSLVLLTANLGVLYKCDDDCSFVLENDKYFGIHLLTQICLFLQIYNLLSFAIFLIFYTPPKKEIEQNTINENNTENNIYNEHDERQSLISKNSGSYLYKFYPNIND